MALYTYHAMSEYEWEPRRVPRTPTPNEHTAAGRRAGSVGEYRVLEHPRESLHWVLGGDPERAGSTPKTISLRAKKLPSFVQRQLDEADRTDP